VDLWDRKGVVPQSMEELMWREKSIRYGSRRNAAESVVEKHQLAAENHQLRVETRRATGGPLPRLEVCQVMFERPCGDPNPQFSFSDADFSQRTFDEMHRLGFDDMRNALRPKKPVSDVGECYAALYRYGTYGKHEKTDREYAEAQRREQQRRS
jgi:hypothetical protein